MSRLPQWLIRTLAAIGAAVIVTSFSPLVPWWTAALRGDWSDGAGEVLIVVAADLLTEQDGDRPATLGYSSQIRCVCASWAWRQHHYRRVIVSGARGAAGAMRTYLTALGVPPEIVAVEPRADSTRDNAVFSLETLGGQTGQAVLLSSDYHMRRAAAAFNKAGLAVKPLPCPDLAKRANGSWTWRLEGARLLSAETAQLLIYWVKGWV